MLRLYDDLRLPSGRLTRRQWLAISSLTGLGLASGARRMPAAEGASPRGPGSSVRGVASGATRRNPNVSEPGLGPALGAVLQTLAACRTGAWLTRDGSDGFFRSLFRRVSGDAVIEVEGVSKSFGETAALVAVDMFVPAGTVQGLLGPNGAGKTTAIRVLSTLLKPDSGRAIGLSNCFANNLC